MSRTLKRFQLPVIFTLFVFFTMLISMFAVITVILALHSLGLLHHRIEGLPLVGYALASILVGTGLSLFVSRSLLRPLAEVMEAMDRVAAGDYSVRVKPSGIEKFRQMGEKFNHMAEELGSVELLRSDFINDFSHEFKTPIVSVRGFAKALKWNDLSDEERNEYLDIILEESERLSDLAENVLNLSRVEKQTILTDRTRFNVSEQLRLAIALMDGKWSDKHINYVFDSGEAYLEGNEALLKQVWINLLDNAAKFSPEGGTVEVMVTQNSEGTSVSISDQGPGMTHEVQAHIFDKFYQGDPARTTKGNGLGLALVKRIVELHQGTVQAHSSVSLGSTFEVFLPK